MGLLEQIYSVFGLGYSIVLAIFKHKEFSGTDKAFMAGSAVFVLLRALDFLNELRLIPWGYKWRFLGKSLLRGLLAPLLWLFYYPILFCCSKCCKRCLTFSNEAYDGVEWTRQLEIFELVGLGAVGGRYLTTHDLFWYGKEEKWGYDTLVGEIAVTVRFEANFNVDTSRKLQTSDWGTTLFLQYKRDTPSQGDTAPPPILEVNTGSVNLPKEKQESMKFSCKEWIWGDPGSSTRTPLPTRGSICADPGNSPETPLLTQDEIAADLETSGTSGTSGTPGTDETRYNVTITWRREIFRIQNREWFRCIGLKKNKQTKINNLRLALCGI